MVVLLRLDVIAHGGLSRLATARPSRCPPQGSRSCRGPGWSTTGRAGHAATGPSCGGCSVSVVAASVNHVVVSPQRAGKYQRLAWRPSPEQKGIDESALMASLQPSPPWYRPHSRPCEHTWPTRPSSRAVSHHRGVLIPLL